MVEPIQRPAPQITPSGHIVLDATRLSMLDKVLANADTLQDNARAASMGEAMALCWIRLQQIDAEIKERARSRSKHASTDIVMLNGEKIGLYALMDQFAKKVLS